MLGMEYMRIIAFIGKRMLIIIDPLSITTNAAQKDKPANPG